MTSFTLRVFSLLVALEAVALAQPVEANKGDAKELMQLGVKLVKSQDYLGALAVFKDAYARFPSAKILLNIGTTLKLLNRNADAVNTYQRYLDSSDNDPTKLAEVQSEIDRLDKDLAKLAITAPAEAELQVSDGEWISAAVGRLYRITPGVFAVHARRVGYKPFEIKGQVSVGQTAAVAVVLEPNPEPVAKQIIVNVPLAPTHEEPRSRIAALAMGHFDVNGGGAAFVGGAFDITDRIQANAAGIIGSNLGGFVGGSFAILTGTLRPMVSAGFPIFINAGARIGVRGAVGLEIVANRHFALVVELGVEHNFNPQSSVEFGGMLRKIDATSFIPALGVTARL